MKMNDIKIFAQEEKEQEIFLVMVIQFTIEFLYLKKEK